MPTDVKVEYKTCLIKLIRSPFPDQVLKVYPAIQEKVIVSSDWAPGEQKWQAIERFLEMHAKHGTVVPKPLPLHSDPKESRSPDFSEADAPVVQLEEPFVFDYFTLEPTDLSAVARPGPIYQNPEYWKHDAIQKALDSDGKGPARQPSVTELQAQIVELTKRLDAQASVAPSSLPVVKDAPAITASVCGVCGKSFKTEIAMKMHVGRFHKEVKK